jgi:DNA polymerase I-like protein with 3'-5' exonuclease and polymerase domains
MNLLTDIESRTLLFDIETNGLLDTMDRIHIIVARDAETRETFVWDRHDGFEEIFDREDGNHLHIVVPPCDDIADGVANLQFAKRVVGHNIVRFDIPAIRKIFPTFYPKGEILDTLVLCRAVVPDTKDGDYRLNRKKRFPTHLIGSHSLDAWGWRVGKHKGDYSKEMIAQGRDPWAEWNTEMEAYAIGDIDVTEIIWNAMSDEMPPPGCIELEHAIHDLCGIMERNGYPFDVAAGQKLAEHLASEIDRASAVAKAKYGRWLAPQKKYQVAMEWDDPLGVNRAKTYMPIRPEFGEDNSRAIWAEVTVSKQEFRRDKSFMVVVDPKTGKKRKVERTEQHRIAYPDKTKDSPYCLVEWKDFNPGSRHHIIDRFTTLHGWVPTDFTEKGFPEVSDAVLQNLIGKIPEAKDVANVLFFKKLHSQLATGKQAWLNCVTDDGRIHGYVNTGGTVSGRCTHNHPNVGQVPAVILGKDPATGKKVPVWGFEGEYGADCRSLFYTPKVWQGELWSQIGIDLSGIELRCLAELCAKFDGGELIEVVLRGDPHQYNMDRTNGVVTQRDIIKRVLYGLMYGAGDYKLGITADPLLNERQARDLGRTLRAALMQGVPALKKAIDLVQADAERGYLIGLDGRRLGVRSKHSALNLRLQSDAALIAKKWTVLTEQRLMDKGLDHGWDGGDFALLVFVHDENQYAAKTVFAELVAETSKQSAIDAGLFFNFKCPIEAASKIGHNWCDCH